MDDSFAACVREPLRTSDGDVFSMLFREYEWVVMTSLVTAFGLDFVMAEAHAATGNDALAPDRHGGDVDTIHNVRKVGSDPLMGYKSPLNASAYGDRGAYDKNEYHSQDNYRTIKHEARAAAMESDTGTIEDSYTGRTIAFTTPKGHPESRVELDHVLSAKWIHDDRGRVLAGEDGAALADDPSNYRFTNKTLNATMGAMEIPAWLERHPEVGGEQRSRMMDAYEDARASYEARIAASYYTSPRFARDLRSAAGRRSAQMAARQVCGLVLAEVWFSIRRRLEGAELGFQPMSLLESLAGGAREGLEAARDKYRELLATAVGGALSGALASVTNTLVNIFITTSRGVGKIIRESYASLVDAARTLIVNPEGYLFGERLRSAAKVIATGASVALGTTVADAVSKTPVAAVPHIGEAVQAFCGALVTGSLSCTLLLYLDRSVWVNRLVTALDRVPTVELSISQLRAQADYLTRYAAELALIDYDALESEISRVEDAVSCIESADTPMSLNAALRDAAASLGTKIPWEGEFGDFMEDPDARLHFT